MSIPGEDFVLRLRWRDPSVLTSNVLDLVIASNDEPVVLVAWEAHDRGTFVQGGFSVIRFTVTGSIRWQTTQTLCGGPGVDCGRWLLKHGAIAMDDDRFVVMGTVHQFDNVNAVESIGIGIDDGGTIAWCRRYQTTFSVGRAMGLAPLAKAGRFLVASRNFNETEAWLYGIDRDGKLIGGLEMRFFDKFAQRLRAVPTQGIFLLGTNNDDAGHPLGWILNVDPATAKRAWERTYDPGDGLVLRWFDAARGNDSTVVGNTGALASPFIATLDGTGNVRTSFRPDAGGAAIVLNGIANTESTSSICGEYNGAAWQIAIDDAINIQWQKKYNHGGSSATLTPIAFANAIAVVAGGQAIVPGDPPRALLVQSQVATSGDPPFHCGEQTNGRFERVDMASNAITSPFKELAMRSYEWYVNQAPLIEIEEGCLL